MKRFSPTLIFLLLLGALASIGTGCGGEKTEKEGDQDTTVTDTVKVDSTDTIPVDTMEKPEDWRTIFHPSLRAPIKPATNTVYAVGFQMAWNQLSRSTAQKIEMEGGPAYLRDLNFAPGNFRDISEDYRIGIAANPGRTAIQRFATEFSRKFAGTDTITPEVDSAGIALLGYVWKPLTVGFPLPYYPESIKFKGQRVDSWGIGSTAAAEKYGHNVVSYNYKGRKDFLVRISSDSLPDEILIARFPEPKPELLRNYININNWMQAEPAPFGPQDRLLIPAFHFEAHQHFEEIEGGIVTNPELKGQKVTTAMEIYRLGLGNDQVDAGRYEASTGGKIMILEGPFFLMIKEKEAPYPWFMMWVNNPQLMWTGY